MALAISTNLSETLPEIDSFISQLQKDLHSRALIFVDPILEGIAGKIFERLNKAVTVIEAENLQNQVRLEKIDK